MYFILQVKEIRNRGDETARIMMAHLQMTIPMQQDQGILIFVMGKRLTASTYIFSHQIFRMFPDVYLAVLIQALNEKDLLSMEEAQEIVHLTPKEDLLFHDRP